MPFLKIQNFPPDFPVVPGFQGFTLSGKFLVVYSLGKHLDIPVVASDRIIELARKDPVYLVRVASCEFRGLAP
jgi:hypothetical protein